MERSDRARCISYIRMRPGELVWAILELAAIVGPGERGCGSKALSLCIAGIGPYAWSISASMIRAREWRPADEALIIGMLIA